MSRTTAKYLGLLALAVIAFHWKTLLTDQFTSIVGYEGVNQTYAWLHFWLRSVWAGHVPLWDPYVFGGRPFTEEMAAFYPVHLLFALFPLNRNDLVSPRLFHEYLAFNRFLGACFMFALLREFGRSRFAAFVGACAFTMAGVLGRLPWPQYMESCIWLPAIFLFLLRALRAREHRRALVEASLGGVCLGMSVLAGGVQFAMIQGICIAAAIAYYAAVHRELRRRMLVGFAVFVLVALGTGAVQLLPSLEFGRLSLRAISGGWFPTADKIPYDRLVKGMWPESLLTGLIPVGQQAGGEEAWPMYIGALPMLLAVTAIWRCWRNLWVRFLAIFAAIVFAYTLGEFSPLFGVLYAVVPYLWMARGASRFVYLISFALAVLSAFGLDAVLEGAGLRERWTPVLPLLKWVAIACAIGLAVPAVFTQITVTVWICVSLVLILASCAWYYRLILRPAPVSLRVAMVAFILFDLTVFNFLAADKNDLVKTGDDYVTMVTLREAASFVRSQPGLHRASVSAPSQPNMGDIYGVQELWGGGAAVLTDFSRMSTHEDLFNVRYRIRPASTPDAGDVYHDTHWKVYEDKNGFPRAWVVHQIDLQPNHEAVFQRIEKGIDLHTVAVLEKMPQPPLEAEAGGDSVRFQSYAPDSMTIGVNEASAGLLVLSEPFYPGWRATVNDRPTEIFKVDGVLRGILVPRGASRVELAYTPLTFYAGGALSVLTLGGVLFAWLRRGPAKSESAEA